MDMELFCFKICVFFKLFPSICQVQIELLLLGLIKFFVESSFVTMEDALGYLIEATNMQGNIQGVLPRDD